MMPDRPTGGITADLPDARSSRLLAGAAGRLSGLRERPIKLPEVGVSQRLAQAVVCRARLCGDRLGVLPRALLRHPGTLALRRSGDY
jgi:hypothetical protein